MFEHFNIFKRFLDELLPIQNKLLQIQNNYNLKTSLNKNCVNQYSNFFNQIMENIFFRLC